MYVGYGFGMGPSVTGCTSRQAFKPETLSCLGGGSSGAGGAVLLFQQQHWLTIV